MTNEVNYAPVKYGCNGSTVDFSFSWKIFESQDLIIILEDDATKEQVVLEDGLDYMLFQDIDGGYIKTNAVYPAGKSIIVSRKVSQFQSKTYSTSSGFQTKEIEESFDKLSANVQDLSYTLERALKVPVGSGKLNVEFPEELINDNTLVWSEEKEAFVNYDVIGEMDAFKAETNNTIEKNKKNVDEQILSFKQDINTQIDDFEKEQNKSFLEFKADVDENIETVLEAAEKVNVLEESVEVATKAANEAMVASDVAAKAANEANAAAKISANKDLSNLSTMGEKHFLNKSQITNCLLEVPQNIKLELNNGTLTLKAGSKAYIPNGSGNFDEYIVSSDRVVDNAQLGGNNQYLLALNNNGSSMFSRPLKNSVSGEGTTAVGGFAYDTSANIISWYNNSGVQQDGRCSLPLCIFSTTGGVPTSIDQVFNGFGYIGSTVFVDKGVKGLIPNGRNADGTLNNIEFVTSTVLTRTMTYAVSDGCLFYNSGNNTIEIGAKAQLFTVYDTLPAPKSSYERCFVEKENQQYFHVAGANTWTKTSNYFIFGDAACSSGGKIDFVKHKQPFRAMDCNDTHIKNFDGQWNRKMLMVAENVSLAITSAETDIEYDLSNYLPNDGYNYEVLLSCNMSTGAKSGAYLNASFVGSGTKNQGEIWSRAMGIVTRSASSMDMFNSAIIPIGLNRKLILRYNVAGAAATLHGIWLEGYRRLGTNE